MQISGIQPLSLIRHIGLRVEIDCCIIAVSKHIALVK